MRMRIYLVFVLSVILGCSSWAMAQTPLKTAWMGESEAFAVWYAKEKGWDKEAGLDISMLHFDSGKSIVEGMLAYKWAVAGCGAVPALTAVLSEHLQIIALATDESAANAIYARKDSPILKVKGKNPEFSDVYGDADSVRGRKFLCPKGTSAHYLLASWLKTLGLQEKDVQIRFMEPTPALGAFSGGLGDGLAVWAPQIYTAENKGFQTVATSAQCGLALPIFIVVNREYADKNPQQIEAFLKMYFRVVRMLRTTPLETLVPDYIRFYQSWAKLTLSEEEALRDLKTHPVLDLKAQQILFDASKGKSDIQRLLGRIVNFYIENGGIRPDERQRLERMNAVTDVYLKALPPE